MRATTRVTTIAVPVVAGLIVFGASVAGGVVTSGSWTALARLPLDGMVAVIVLAVLPWPRWRRGVAAAMAAVFTLSLLSAALDRGFSTFVGNSFNVVTGWPELVDGYGVLRDSEGSLAALGILLALGLAVVASVVLVAWALLVLARVTRSHVTLSVIGASSLTAVWAVLALVGAQIVPGVPVAAADAVHTVVSRADQAAETERAQAAFARAETDDPLATTPAGDLLTGLRGKDVVIAFIESYGQVAVQGTSFSRGVDRVLRAGQAQLRGEGYSERSAFLTSSTFGGISWLAHSTLQTGQWIDSQQRYDQVTSGTRFTLSDAFAKAGFRTISDVPSDAKPWPVGKTFYHFDTELNSQNVGYAGPRFSYARIPDQYTWAWLEKHELEVPHQPLMAEIDFDSSHTPWTPLPRLEPWSAIGDGSVYTSQPAEGLTPSAVWTDPRHVQQLYGQSIEYSLGSLFSFVHESTDPNLVLVVLGDHQPSSEVSGSHADHEVPISIIAKDPAVVDSISSWHWEPGLLPSPSAPDWSMADFRNRFLTAYGR